MVSQPNVECLLLHDGKGLSTPHFHMLPSTEEVNLT